MTHFKKMGLPLAIGALLASGNALAASTISFNSSWHHSNYSGVDGNSALPSDWSGPAIDKPSYTGSMPANWFVKFDSAGGTAAVTSAGALAAGASELMTGARAERDTGNNWGHNADYGLLHLDAAADVTINLSSDNSLIGSTYLETGTTATALSATLAPGFAIWKNWDLGGSRHSDWMANGDMLPYGSIPLSAQLTPIAGLSGCNTSTAACAFNATKGTASTISTASLTLTNLAAGDYTIILGGHLGTAGDFAPGGKVAYTASISAVSTSPVPVPAAAWLFGGALASLASTYRRKRVIPA